MFSAAKREGARPAAVGETHVERSSSTSTSCEGDVVAATIHGVREVREAEEAGAKEGGRGAGPLQKRGSGRRARESSENAAVRVRSKEDRREEERRLGLMRNRA